VGRVVASWSLLMGVVVLVGLPTGAQAAASRGASRVLGGACVSPAPHGFSDVPAGSYFDVAVGWLLEAEITSGSSPGKVLPGPIGDSGADGGVPVAGCRFAGSAGFE
jgi:hypothetical protein